MLLRGPPPISPARHRATPLPWSLRRWPTSPVPRRTKRRRRSRSWRGDWIQKLESKATTDPGRRSALSSIRVGLLRGGGGGAASSSVRRSMGHGGTFLLLCHYRRWRSSHGGVEGHAPQAVGASAGALSSSGGDGSTDDFRGASRRASPPSPRWEHVRPRPSAPPRGGGRAGLGWPCSAPTDVQRGEARGGHAPLGRPCAWGGADPQWWQRNESFLPGVGSRGTSGDGLELGPCQNWRQQLELGPQRTRRQRPLTSFPRRRRWLLFSLLLPPSERGREREGDLRGARVCRWRRFGIPLNLKERGGDVKMAPLLKEHAAGCFPLSPSWRRG
jgi:hypothetical protein